MKFITWIGNGLTLLGGAAAIASPLLNEQMSTKVAITGGVVALIGSVISMYTGHVQGRELDGVRELAKPRRLDVAAAKGLAQHLHTFAGQQFELYVHNHDESRRFGDELAQCLIASGFKQAKPRGDVLVGNGMVNLVEVPVTGVVVGGPVVGEVAAAAYALALHLKKLGFEAKAEQHVEFDQYPDRIHVYVGMKIRGLA